MLETGRLRAPASHPTPPQLSKLLGPQGPVPWAQVPLQSSQASAGVLQLAQQPLQWAGGQAGGGRMLEARLAAGEAATQTDGRGFWL